MSRWVRVSVDIFEHEFFATAEPFSEREAWLWLISNAAWKDTQHRIGNEMVDVPAGSLFVTLRGLQSAWRWKSDKRVRSFISRLENGRMVETKTDAGKTHITICNYTRFQDAGRKEDAARTQAGRSADALKTPVHQYTNTSSLRSDDCPEPEKSAPASPTFIELPSTQDGSVPVSEADVAEWHDAYPGVDVRQQLRSMRQWLLANPANRKTPRGMRKFVVAWLGREQDKGRPAQRQQAPPMTFHQQHQQAALKALDERLGIKRNDNKPSSSLDLDPSDWRAHRPASAGH